MQNWCAVQWQTPIGATEYPVELKWKPTGAPNFEYWQWRTAHGAHLFVVVRVNQALEPVGSGSSVIVEERDHLPARQLHRSIAGRAKVPIIFICHHDDWYWPWALATEVFFAPPQ